MMLSPLLACAAGSRARSLALMIAASMSVACLRGIAFALPLDVMMSTTSEMMTAGGWILLISFFSVMSVGLFLYATRGAKAQSSASATLPPRFPVLWRALRGDFELGKFGPVKALKIAQREKGDIFRVRLPLKPCTFLVGQNAVKTFFSASNKVLSSREAYKFMIPVFGPNVVYDATRERMSSQLRFVKHGLSRAALREAPKKIFREVRDYVNTSLAFQGKDQNQSGQAELYEATSELIINTASRCLLGDEVRETVHSEFTRYYFELEQGVSHVSFFAPWLPTSAHRKRDAARKKLSEVFTPIIRRRRDAMAAGLDLPDDYMQRLLEGEYRDGTTLDDESVVGLLVAALFGGQHTSNITTSWLIMNVCSPEAKRKGGIWDRLLSEQRLVLEKHCGEMSFDALGEMVLLENCIKETLRKYPPLIVLMRKATQDLPFGDKGIFIPKGDLVCISPSVQGMLPEIFSNPETFNPDRFGPDGTSGEAAFEPKILRDAKNGWIPFGGGRHACVGRYFAFLQIKSIVSLLIRHFDMEWLDTAWKDNIDYSQIVATPPPCWIKWRRRSEPIYPAI